MIHDIHHLTMVHIIYTSVVIYHRGGSLSEQHTDLLYPQSRICHTQVDMLMSLHQRYPGIAYVCQQLGHLLSA